MNSDQVLPGAQSSTSEAPGYFFNRYCLFSVLAAVSYPILFAFVYKPDLQVILCSTVHAILAALVLYRVVSKSFLRHRYNASLAVVFILINLLYLSASSIKYFESELTPGFVTNNLVRFLFSILAMVVLWSSYEIVSKWEEPRFPPSFSLLHANALRIVILVLIVLLSYTIVDGFQQGLGFIYTREGNFTQLAIDHTYLSTGEKIKEWFPQFFMSFMPVFLALYYRKRESKLLIVAALLLMLSYSLISGSRGMFVVFAAVLTLSLIRLYGAARKLFSYAVLSAPLLICVFSIITLSVSNRVNLNDLDTFRKQLAYRFDISDFAATIVTGHGGPSFGAQHIVDAFYYAIPKFLCPDKYGANSGAYFLSLVEANLNEYTDYADTFFSMGAQLYGIIGYVCFPFLMIVFLHYLEKLLSVFRGGKAILLTVVFIPLAILVETDLNNLFGVWRMLPVYVVFGLVLEYVFIGVSRRHVSQI